MLPMHVVLLGRTEKICRNSKKLEKGQVGTRHTDNMMMVRWKDKRERCMLTTLHTDTMKQSGKVDRTTNTPLMKSKCVMDCNKYMGQWTNQA
jgi:hypothetical protein